MPAVKESGQRAAADGFLGRVVHAIREYFVSLRVEWGKISFPTRKELYQSTLVVFLFTIALMVVISAFDALMSLVFDKILLPPI